MLKAGLGTQQLIEPECHYYSECAELYPPGGEVVIDLLLIFASCIVLWLCYKSFE